MITCKEKQEKNSLQVLNVLLSEREHLKKKHKRNLPKCAGVGRSYFVCCFLINFKIKMEIDSLLNRILSIEHGFQHIIEGANEIIFTYSKG